MSEAVNHYHIVLVEDDQPLADALAETLRLACFNVQAFSQATEALAAIDTDPPDLIISDIRMPGMSGHQLLEKLQANMAHIPVLLITAHGDVADAVQAMRTGAADYLMKPFTPDVLLSVVKRFLPKIPVKQSEPVAADAKTKEILSMARKVAATEATVLISGESGTGKEVLAHYIHDHSPRHQQVFVAINCAAIPENMLEASLFGYEKGAFTGAYKTTTGKFEQAQGGTLLLDEISEMDLPLQAKLLRVLQEKELERIGGQKTIALDVRVIATTNRQLREAVHNKTFREDLYYRLNVFPLHWVPIRERRDDILPLVDYLLQRHRHSGADHIPQLTQAAKQALLDYPWPGNAREMDNIIQRALILKTGNTIDVGDLCFEAADTPNKASELSHQLRDHQFDIIQEVLKTHTGNRKAAAAALGISERTLRYKIAKMRELGMDIGETV